MELVYLWVEEYKNIHRQGFNFSPRFKCEYDPDTNELTIDENDDYVDIFPDNINVTAIVGKNGSGKSSVLELITDQLQNEYCIYILKYMDIEKLYIFDSINIPYNITCHCKYEKNPKILKSKIYVSLLYIKSYIDINTYDARQLNILPRSFFNHTQKQDFFSELYKVSTKLFNRHNIDTKQNSNDSLNEFPYNHVTLSKYFSELRNSYFHKILIHYSLLEKFLKQYFYIITINFRIKSLDEIFFDSPKFKDTYKEDKFLLNMFENFNVEKNTKNKLLILSLIFLYLEDNSAKTIIQNTKFTNYLQLIKTFQGQDNDYLKIWDDFINEVEKKEPFDIFITKYLDFTKYIRHEILEFDFIPTLSSGQEKLLYLIINIYDYFTHIIPKHIGNSTILIDEPDTLQHPNWQKKFIFLLTQLLNTFFKEKNINIILTTHSPFLLSDIPKQNIIFLDTDEEGNCKVVDGLNDKKETFGANIHTLLSDSFFMEDGLMGEFAKGKINEIIEFHKNIDAELAKPNPNLSPFKDEYKDKEKKFKQVQSIIGEEYLKQVIQNYIIEIDKILLGKDEALEKEIERLRAKADRLESLKNVTS